MEKKQQRNSLITKFINKFRSRKNTHTSNRKISPNSDVHSIRDIIDRLNHWDGYTREKAITWLAQSEHPDIISALISRCNDWVQEVRKAAKKAILNLTTTQYTQDFIKVLPDIYHLKNCGRENHDDFIHAIERFLISEENNHHLIAGINSENSKVSKLCFSLVLDNKLINNHELLFLGIGSRNVSVRLKSCYLIDVIDKKSQKKALETAIKDDFMPVRRFALRQFIHNGLSEQALKNFLFDKHKSIRRIAINNLPRIKSKNLYIDHLNSESLAKVCYPIWGLGELNDTDSAQLIKTQLTSAFPSIRRYALTSITKLMKSDASTILKQYLIDDSPKVVKEASRLASTINMALSADEMLTLISSDNHHNSLKLYANIFYRMNKWERLIFILNLLSEEYTITQKLIEDEAHLWHKNFNRKLTQPSNTQIESLLQLFNNYQHLLNADVKKIIQFTLSTYGGKA